MTKYTTGRVDIQATALDAIHHGAGTRGNISILRTQEIIDPATGQMCETPYISGNSIKHAIRQHAVEHALDAMDVQDGTLSKQVVDLLFSGGHLSKAGAAVSLKMARELSMLFPALSLCGYSAGNFMTQSKVRCDHWHLLAAENAWRTPSSLTAHQHVLMPADDFKAEEFGTRHESTRNQRVAGLLRDEVKAALDEKKTEQMGLLGPTESPNKPAKPKKGSAAEKAGLSGGDTASAQMIYEYEVIKPGALLFGAIHLRDVSQMELAAFQASLSHWCTDRMADGFVLHVGAKNGTGCGRMLARFSGQLRVPVTPTEMAPTTELAPQRDPPTEYVTHLVTHRDEILRKLEEVMG